MALLEVRNLQVNYGPIQAVKGIDLDVEECTITALLGANGAGKTSTHIGSSQSQRLRMPGRQRAFGTESF